MFAVLSCCYCGRQIQGKRAEGGMRQGSKEERHRGRAQQAVVVRSHPRASAWGRARATQRQRHHLRAVLLVRLGVHQALELRRLGQLHLDHPAGAIGVAVDLQQAQPCRQTGSAPAWAVGAPERSPGGRDREGAGAAGAAGAAPSCTHAPACPTRLPPLRSVPSPPTRRRSGSRWSPAPRRPRAQSHR